MNCATSCLLFCGCILAPRESFLNSATLPAKRGSPGASHSGLQDALGSLLRTIQKTPPVRAVTPTTCLDHSCFNQHTHIYIYMSVCVIHTFVCICICTHMYVYMYTHLHIYTLVCVEFAAKTPPGLWDVGSTIPGFTRMVPTPQSVSQLEVSLCHQTACLPHSLRPTPPCPGSGFPFLCSPRAFIFMCVIHLFIPVLRIVMLCVVF